MDVTDSIRHWLVDFSRIVRGVLGADAYENYLAHHEATHDTENHPPMTEREFWHDRDDRQDHNPQGRCC